MDRANQVQVAKVVWWRRYLPDVVVMLLLLILVRPHTPVHTLLVCALLCLFWSVLCGGMTVVVLCAVLLAFWGWLGGRTHVETACEMIFGLIRRWLPEHSE